MTAGETAASAIGAILISALAWYLILVESAFSDRPNIDPLRWTLAAKLYANLSPQSEDMRAMMMIFANENGGGNDLAEGDLDLPAGPSIGPGKVYRQTATELGLWVTQGDDAADRAAYAAFGADPANEATLIGWAVIVYLDKKRQANGVIWGNDGAIRRYNGRGDKARAYAANALADYQETYA